MDIIINLYNESRRYCIYNSAFWDKQGSELGEKNVYRYNKTKEFAFYQAEEYSNSNSRKGILEFILNEIEKTMPENFKTIEDMKKHIMYIVENSKIDEEKHIFKPYKSYLEKAVHEAVEDEKQKLKNFIISLDEENLQNVKPLFYRKAFTEEEGKAIKKSLEEIYRKLTCDDKDILYGNCLYIDKELPPQILRNIFIKRGIKNLYEIYVGRKIYREIDVSIFDPYNVGESDRYWSSSDMDWVISANHEGDIYICGSWLIDAITSEVPSTQSMLNKYVDL